MTTTRLFEMASHAKAYSKYRPSHPKELYEKIVSFASRHSVPLDLIVDVGCGSGQSTHQLSPHAKKVIGTDVSSAQISNAQPLNDNVTFLVAPAHELPVDNASVSMLTCGQAWHYMDPPLVNPEIHRVLRKPGILAIYGHDLPLIKDETCRSLILEFYGETLKGYWHQSRRLIDEHFRSVSLPLPLTEREDMEFDSSSSLDDYVSYVDTWSGYQAYLSSHPKSNVLNELKEKLRTALHGNVDKLSLVTPYFLLLCLHK